MRALLVSKAFLAAVVVALGIAAVTAAVSATIDRSARDTYKIAGVRL